MMGYRRATLSLAMMVAALLAWPTAGQALSLPVPTAEVVFSNGGRILSMEADGSGRRVLFGKNRRPANDGLGAIEPAVSPDGETIVFGVRRRAGYETLTDVWKVRANGTGARRLLKSTLRNRFGDPDFTPDGRIVFATFSRQGRKGKAAIFTMSADGGSRKAIHSLPQRLKRWMGWKIFAEPSISPDGGRLLYLQDSDYSGTLFENEYGSELRIMNLSTRKSRKISDDSLGAAWSPDGRRIAFSEVDNEGDEDFCWSASYSCLDFSRVRVVNADGTGSRLLTRSAADERSPDWSADGRIVFQSARDKREIAETTEIYSILPDGRCLTRLTNGSPASLMPAWSDPERSGTAPPSCGADPPGPNVELNPFPASVSRVVDFWLGPGFRNILLSHTEADRRSSSLYYGDCGAIPVSKCGRELFMANADICEYRGYMAAVLGSPGLQEQRGIPVLRSLRAGRETPPYTMLFTDRTLVYMIGGSGIGKRKEQHRREIDALRKVGEEGAAGDLPAPLIPIQDLRQMRKVKRVFARTGSVAQTAKRFGRRAYFVRSNLRFARKVESAGYRSVKCPTRSKSSSSDSSSDRRALIPSG